MVRQDELIAVQENREVAMNVIGLDRRRAREPIDRLALAARRGVAGGPV